MAETPQPGWGDDRFGAYLRRWAPREMLLADGRFRKVSRATKARFGLDVVKGDTRNGMVRVRVPEATPELLEKVVDKVRGDLELTDLSPVHRTMIGQPNVVGNPEDVLPRSAEPGVTSSGDDGAGVTVALIDTGIEPHRDLDSSQASPGDYEWQVMVRYGGRDVLGPQAGHCVFLAGLVLRQAPAANVLAIKTADSFGISDIDDVAAAIVRAANRGADVINLSLGCTTRKGKEPWVLRRALDKVGKMKAPPAVVASAGNSNGTEKFWPAAFDGVTAVGAVENTGGWRLAPFTNCGAWVDVYVPASDVLSTYIQYTGLALFPSDDRTRLIDKFVDYHTGWATWTGTSMASAIWSGVVARAVSRARAGGSAAPPAEIARSLPDRPSDVELPALTLVAADHKDDEGKPRRAYGVDTAGPSGSSDS